MINRSMTDRDVSRLRRVSTRSISPENPDGAKGGGARSSTGTGAHASRELGVGWKVSPSVDIEPGSTHPMATIEGAGLITHLWLTVHHRQWRRLVLRAYWDDADEPAIEVPIGDFFASGWGEFAQVSSAVICANPNGGFASYWPMPFRTGARLTIENLGPERATVYYQLDYEVDDHDEPDPASRGYLHAHFRRDNPLVAGAVHSLVDGVSGRGHYVGTYLAWASNSPGWWGEGEVKFFLDDDAEHPTICGTGTEDYFGGAWNFDVPGRGYTEFSTPYLGLPQVLRPDGAYVSQQRFGMYRWHLPDPIHFATRLRAEVQALVWQSGGRYLPLHDDIASTALFYLDAPSSPRPSLPHVDQLQVGVP